MIIQSEPAPLRLGRPSEEHMRLASLARLLGGYRYRYGSEVQLHDAMASVLESAGLTFERELRLDARNRVDFWLDGIVIEVKVGGSLSEALHQADRYVHLPMVTGVLLASTERWGDTSLRERPAWNGKPFQLVRLSRQAL
ncbi:hypothetical protein [Xanthomonas theicola]|uniref:DUF4143 domain-containing protein n=1 Tax=Xanthomonas theicola TaxID=56464 RepID=A0A2S6ZLY2_9XANT|nr:hypothetical protein [Xanthomonas theicola]PPT93254.1 hypothetical protein XthCFBP4691_01190 [Xanthomonas theicola]QNH24809.1 hypothetical protein G4Q83_08700 [Xanthomonas theicola]